MKKKNKNISKQLLSPQSKSSFSITKTHKTNKWCFI